MRPKGGQPLAPWTRQILVRLFEGPMAREDVVALAMTFVPPGRAIRKHSIIHPHPNPVRTCTIDRQIRIGARAIAVEALHQFLVRGWITRNGDDLLSITDDGRERYSYLVEEQA